MAIVKAYMEYYHIIGVAHNQLGNHLRSTIQQLNLYKSNKIIKQESITSYAKKFTRCVKKSE